jgi:hypothetical protein
MLGGRRWGGRLMWGGSWWASGQRKWWACRHKTQACSSTKNTEHTTVHGCHPACQQVCLPAVTPASLHAWHAPLACLSAYVGSHVQALYTGLQQDISQTYKHANAPPCMPAVLSASKLACMPGTPCVLSGYAGPCKDSCSLVYAC